MPAATSYRAFAAGGTLSCHYCTGTEPRLRCATTAFLPAVTTTMNCLPSTMPTPLTRRAGPVQPPTSTIDCYYCRSTAMTVANVNMTVSPQSHLPLPCLQRHYVITVTRVLLFGRVEHRLDGQLCVSLLPEELVIRATALNFLRCRHS